jgi:hypothetical protein
MKSTDRSWYLDVHTFSRHTGWAHGFMEAYALWLGLVLLALMAILAWFWARRRRRLDGVVIAVLAGVSALISLGVNHFVSQAVARTRPCHGALAMGLLLFDVRWGILATLLALFLAFSRVYVGVHYPADVIAGLLLGAVIALIVFVALRRPALTLTNRLARTPLRPLVAAGAAYETSPTYRT